MKLSFAIALAAGLAAGASALPRPTDGWKRDGVDPNVDGPLYPGWKRDDSKGDGSLYPGWKKRDDDA
ncbi:uncharacterized protein N7506_008396 [Penicillium brevicompactum]|uniref:uncharacterized protein n=1 Tax=Penicillium brevicompactum TaxID=5074 RepID=UPI00254162A1|nr:uncharacterized protein N7506_008396 [Penicillium brevicompactum]KAJ5325294.1 hypothetical protein N7506_008396 [Penicillium brevicompactum]